MSGSILVFDKYANPQVLGELLGKGGEGHIYPLAQRDGIIVKCYHPEKLRENGPRLAEKIQAMCAIRDQFTQTPVKWPLLSVFDMHKNWVGYAMYRAEGVPMARLAHAMLYEKSFPGLNRIGIVSYLIAFLDAVATLHREGVMIGDYNLNNIMCVPGSGRVVLIDCDSYQFERDGRFYPCPVGSPDMTPPEQHGQSFDRIRRTEASELFSIAIVLFKCLMLGRHPYDVVGGSDPVSNLREGRFAYGRGNKGIPKGPWYNIWSHMPYRLKDRFISVFTEGAGTPEKRPSIAEWRNDLSVYRNEMQKGWHETTVRPARSKSSDHRGRDAASQDRVSISRAVPPSSPQACQPAAGQPAPR